MKKPLAILLAFFIVFAPVYSNAVLPALAASAASATRVLVGATIKKVSPSALANAKKAAIGICKSNPSTCKSLGLGVGGVIGALVGDGWNIEITNNDVTNIDVDIYKINNATTNTCTIDYYYAGVKAACYYSGPPPAPVNYQSSYSSVLSCESKENIDSAASRGLERIWHNYESTNASLKDSEMKSYVSQNREKLLLEMKEGTYYGYGNSSDKHYYNNKSNPDGAKLSDAVSSRFYYKKTCSTAPTNNKTYITNYELNQYVTNNTTNNDIDIKDIYNFDFSQYNINIGGNTYNGTTINNDLSKSDPSEADKKVSPDLKNKLDDKTISLDDVNDQNCTKNEAGEYDKCGDETDPTDPTDPEEPTDPEPEPEPPPIECDANGFYKKVCDWMDWTQKPHDKPDSGNVDIIDKSEGLNIDQNRIDFTNQCPAPTPINTSVGGFPVSTELNYQPLCDFFIMLNPFVIGMGGISSALIIAGGARRG